MRTPVDGRTVVTTGGTAVQINSTNNTKVGAILITAETNNTGIIAVGASTVVAAESTRRGHPLAAGESIALNPGWSGDEGLLDLSDIYIDATVNGDGVTYTALQ